MEDIFSQEYSDELLKKIKSQKKEHKKYIYIIQCVGYDYYKIGIADAPNLRLKDLQSGCPFPLKILSSVELTKPMSIERKLHHCFAKKKLRGEWFNLTKANIKRLKKLFSDIKNL